jgi:hypothetical protein
LYSLWWSVRDVNGTLEEWVKKSDAELAEIENEIQQLHDLLGD